MGLLPMAIRKEQKWDDPIIYKNAIIVLTEGSYDEYQIDCVFKAVEKFDINNQKTMYEMALEFFGLFDKKPSFTEYLVTQGLIKTVNFREINLSHIFKKKSLGL